MNKLPAKLKKRSITLTLPPGQLKALREAAENLSVSQSALASRALLYYFTVAKTAP